MKRYSILVLLTFLFLRANAQPKELILNGGFEDVRKPLIGSSLYRIEYLDTMYPYKGNNIVAMGVDTYNQLPNSHYFKEYLQTKLISGIKPGKKYKISFYYNFYKR